MLLSVVSVFFSVRLRNCQCTGMTKNVDYNEDKETGFCEGVSSQPASQFTVSHFLGTSMLQHLLPSNVKTVMEKYLLLWIDAPNLYLAWERKENKGIDCTFQGYYLRRAKQEEASSKRGTMHTNLELAVVDCFSHISS